MKNINYIIFTFIFLFINVFYVHASCTNEEISRLKDLADDIKVTYKHLGKVEYEDGTVSYNVFNVKVKNFSDELYISLFNDTIKITPENGEASKRFNNGTWNFEVYSNNCEEKISEIKVFIPRFNLYSLDPLCEGVDGDDFALCGKYYEYNVSYESFKERVEHYRIIHKIKNDNTSDNDDIDFDELFNKILDFIIKYKFYFIGGLLSLIIIILIVIVVKRRKKRGVLE